jgi:CBS domain containing-hemolysin-like protein
MIHKVIIIIYCIYCNSFFVLFRFAMLGLQARVTGVLACSAQTASVRGR